MGCREVKRWQQLQRRWREHLCIFHPVLQWVLLCFPETETWFVEALELWRQEVGLSKFTLLGHSFGGFISARYALKVRSLAARLLPPCRYAWPQHLSYLGPSIRDVTLAQGALKIDPLEGFAHPPCFSPSSQNHVGFWP